MSNDPRKTWALDREIVLCRVINAPRERVFAAWTDPNQIRQWFGPAGFKTETLECDIRPGGIWRFVMHGPDGRDYQNRITYDEIVPPERLVYHHDGATDVEPVQFTQTLTFESLGQNRTRLVWHGRFPSAEDRTRVIEKYGADKGLVQTMSRLVDYVATLAAERA